MNYALQTLWHERSRFLPGILAVAFSAVLIALQCGLLMGLFSITSLPIDHSGADIWVGSPKVLSVDLGRPIPQSFMTRIAQDRRVAYVEAHDDETKETATAVLRNAVAWFADRGVIVQRVLSDNGSCYRSHLWRDTCAELGITPKKTRPYRPQTNGKIERFHRTLADGWAFSRCYGSESARRKALPAWLHDYNHHRLHTAIGKVPPITRLTNLRGQYI